MSFGLDLSRLLKLRLIVGRHGEMDGARWWNTNGLLGRTGGSLISRGFPKTHNFAQARLVFEVARARSADRFSTVSGCVTLWNLPARVEDEFDAQWARWLDDGDSWAEFFAGLQAQNENLLTVLRTNGLIGSDHEAQVSRLRRSAEGRSVPIPGIRHVDDDTIILLAAGFSRGQVAKLAIPYARVDG